MLIFFSYVFYVYECFPFIFVCALQACLVPEARKQVSDSSI